ACKSSAERPRRGKAARRVQHAEIARGIPALDLLARCELAREAVAFHVPGRGVPDAARRSRERFTARVVADSHLDAGSGTAHAVRLLRIAGADGADEIPL